MNQFQDRDEKIIFLQIFFSGYFSDKIKLFIQSRVKLVCCEFTVIIFFLSTTFDAIYDFDLF